MSHPAYLLGEDGPFPARIPGFTVRSGQQEMAETIARVLDDPAVAVCEAGTGTGKTLAYLVPALSSGRKALISTATKNLQDQLFEKDLPEVRDALGLSPACAVLKGRSNYLCLEKLESAEAQPERLAADDLGALSYLRNWAAQTSTGDKVECIGLAEDASVWRRVTSTTDSCLGPECMHFDKCFVVRARRKAAQADIVVANHHLLCADLVLKEQGFGEILPDVEALIIDEAHQFPDIAATFLGSRLTGGQIVELCRDTLTAGHQEARESEELPALIQSLDKAARDFRLAFGARAERVAWEDVQGKNDVHQGLDALANEMTELGDVLEALSVRGIALNRCHQRCVEMRSRFSELAEVDHDEHVAWLDLHDRGFDWRSIPLNAGEMLAESIYGRQRTWVFTSATLSVAGDFDYFARRAGLQERQEYSWPSPFQYQEKCLLMVPESMPEPASEAYAEAVSEVAAQVVLASRGRAFLLFTSHRMMRDVRQRLSALIDFPMLVQGDAPRTELLQRFRSLGDAVLLGTASFWEGVDVRGEALSCVLIDKLPFTPPDDPMLRARGRVMRKEGGEPFRELQLPQAALSLRQGAGRLIRDESDRGVLVICDPRILGRSYGKIFLRSLPEMPLTRDMDDVRDFFSESTGTSVDSETGEGEPRTTARQAGAP